MNFDKRLIRLASGVRLLYGFSLLTGVGAAVMLVFQADKISEIVNRVFIDGYQADKVRYLMQMLMGIIILRSILLFISKSLASIASAKIMIKIRDSLIRQYLSLEPLFIRQQDSASHLNVLIDGVDDLEAYFSQYLPQIIYSVFIPIVMLIFIFPVDKISAFIFLITAPLIPVFMILIGKRGEKLNNSQWVALNRLRSHFLDTIQGLTTLKAFNQSIKQVDRIAESSEEYRLITMKVLRVTFLSAFVLEFIAMISTAIIAVEVGLRLLYWKVNFQNAFFLLLLAPEFYVPLRQLGLKFHAGMSGITAANKIFAVLEEPVNEKIIFDTPSGLKKRSKWIEKFHIQFDDVSYRYPERSQGAIEHFSFEIKPGTVMALVGESGSGKTTIARMLNKFLYPTGGNILVNNIQLQDINTAQWRENVGWVPQKPFLFHKTIAENIRIGKPSASDQEVIDAAKNSNLHDFICSLPNGYNTLIGENAACISGGEAQRIALARVFVKDARFVILDEPMTNLDLENEQLLRESIRKMYENRTMLIIAHYLPTIMHADEIVVIQNGRISEQGSHGQLQNNQGFYQKILASHLL